MGVSDMVELRIAKLPDRNPVKITIAVLPELHDALHDYAKLYWALDLRLVG